MKTSINAFTPCASCHCLVRSADPACPFCHAPLVSLARRFVGGPRMSRAMWLVVGGALSAMSGAGCSSSSPSASLGSVAGGAAADPQFKCGDKLCDSATEYCMHVSFTCKEAVFGSDVYGCDPLKAIPACIEGSLPSGASCSLDANQDPTGAVELELLTYVEDSHCSAGNAGCYGAPPARSERRGAPVVLSAFAST